MKEELVFFGESDSLVGILACPDHPSKPRPAILLINAGIVHRVGPNRLHVKLARWLADEGFPVLRFDLSGIGDSRVRSDHLSFDKSCVQETQQAMAFLRDKKGVGQFFLVGICSGADIAFLTACEDPQVTGTVLINGRSFHGVTEDDEGEDELNTLMKQKVAQRYVFMTALTNPQSWLRALKGQIDFAGAVKALLSRCKNAIFPPKISSPGASALKSKFRALVERGVRVFLLYSEGDPGLDYLNLMLSDEMKKLGSRGNLQKQVIERADHTFTLLSKQKQLFGLIRDWAASSSSG